MRFAESPREALVGLVLICAEMAAVGCGDDDEPMGPPFFGNSASESDRSEDAPEAAFCFPTGVGGLMTISAEMALGGAGLLIKGPLLFILEMALGWHFRAFVGSFDAC